MIMVGMKHPTVKNIQSIGLYIGKELNELTKEAALKENLTKSELICKAVEKYLKEAEHKSVNHSRKYASHAHAEQAQYTTVFLPKDLRILIAEKSKKAKLSINNFVAYAIREYLGISHPEPHTDLTTNPYKQVTLHLDDSLYLLLEQEAKKEGITKVQFIRDTVKESFEIEHSEAKRKI